MRALKGHGTENDFIVIPDLDGLLDLDAAMVRALCDRRAGVGADGVLRAVRPEHEADWADRNADFAMDFRNANGSVGEMCGNGVRVFAAYLRRAGVLRDGTARIATRGGVRTVTVAGPGTFAVDMGPARVHPDVVKVHTGGLVASFGKNGIVDLKEGVVYGNRQPINLETGEIGLHSTPT